MSLAQDIVQKLGGDWHSHYGLCPGPGHNKRDRSLKVSPHRDDENDVFVYSFCGDDVLALKAEWRERGLLPRGGRSGFNPEKIAKTERGRQKRDNDDAADAEERLEKARWLCDQRRPDRGTIVQKYMIGRGIDLDPFPPTIGHLPARPPKYPHPAMIVAFGEPEEPEPGAYRTPREAINGVLLTYLKPDGSGKADTAPQKRMIGRPLGSPLALIPPNDGLGLIIGEGIETALDAYLKSPMGCWAAGSAPFLPALADAVPEYIESVTIAVDKDPTGRRMAAELARRLEERSIEIFMMEPR
jgi:hypothetical protein